MKIDVGIGGVVIAAITAITAILVHRDAQNASLKRRAMEGITATAIQDVVDDAFKQYPPPYYWDEKGIEK